MESLWTVRCFSRRQHLNLALCLCTYIVPARSEKCQDFLLNNTNTNTNNVFHLLLLSFNSQHRKFIFKTFPPTLYC